VVESARCARRRPRCGDVCLQRFLDVAPFAPASKLLRVEPDVGRRGGEQLGLVEEAAEHRAHAQPAQERRFGFRGVQTRRYDGTTRGLGRGGS
jgi:hypothetical protein